MPSDGAAPVARAPAARFGLHALATSTALAALVLLPLAAWAFWPRYLSRPGTVDGYTHAHAALGSAWLLLLLAQPWLVRVRRWALHRWLGRAGLIVGAAFVVWGVLTAHRALVRMDAETFARDGFFVYMPLAMTAIFAAALCLAMAWRASPPVHGRFMACTLLPLLDPVFARILGFHFPPLPAEALYQLPALLAMVGTLVWLELTLPPRIRGRGAFVLFAVGSTTLYLAFFLVEHNRAWLAFVAWFRGLPLS